MKRLLILTMALAVALPLCAQSAHRPIAQQFASDFQTVPVMGNTPGFGGATFQTYVAILNPTAASFPVDVTLYDTAGAKHNATITLAAGEVKTYNNFLAEVFNFQGGGAATFKSSDPANRFILNVEVRTSGTHYSTMIPPLEFAGSSSRSFAPGITVDASTRTNIGCFNQSDAGNTIKATVWDNSGRQNLGTITLNLAGNAWGQTSVTPIVSGGYIQFDPSDNAVCYAVAVDNATSDGRFINAVEYRP